MVGALLLGQRKSRGLVIDSLHWCPLVKPHLAQMTPCGRNAISKTSFTQRYLLLAELPTGTESFLETLLGNAREEHDVVLEITYGFVSVNRRRIQNCFLLI